MWKLKKKHTYLSVVNLILHNYFMDHVCITHNGYLLGFVSSYYISLIGVENLGMLINFINYIWRYFNSFRATIAIVKRSCTLGFVLSKELWVLQSRSSLWSITEAATHYHIMITHYCLDETNIDLCTCVMAYVHVFQREKYGATARRWPISSVLQPWRWWQSNPQISTKPAQGLDHTASHISETIDICCRVRGERNHHSSW